MRCGVVPALMIALMIALIFALIIAIQPAASSSINNDTPAAEMLWLAIAFAAPCSNPSASIRCMRRSGMDTR